MILNFTEQDEDIKFICYVLNKDCKFVLSERLSLEIDGEIFDTLEAIIERLYSMNGESFTQNSIKDFKRYRNAPSAINFEKITVILLLNYILLVKTMLSTGNLKNKDYIDKISQFVNFDPDFLLLEIKTGKIEKIAPVLEMDKLYVENVLADREYHICSGLRNVYSAEELQGNIYLFLLNIKKVKLGIEESEGMICCAENSGKVEAIKLNLKENTRIQLEGSLEIFQKIKYEKIDIKKPRYANALQFFRIIDHHLTFKGKKVLCGGEYVKTTLSEGVVR